MARMPELFKADVHNAHTQDMRITFGKHKGLIVGQVLANDPGWLIWAHYNVSWFKLREEVLVSARKAHSKRMRARQQDSGVFDLEREVRHMMSGTFGVHMNDMDLFLEGDIYPDNDDDAEADDWRNTRPY